MGGVNDLDLFYDEVDDLFYIVDRKITPTLQNVVPRLSLSGTKSVMSNVQISSQISKNIANMVSIAAQGTSGNSRDNVAPLLKWNTGLLDRHIRHKTQVVDTEGDAKVKEKKEKRLTAEDERLQKWVEDYYDYWREFNGDKFFDNGDFNANIVPSLSNYHKRFCQTWVVERYYKNDSDPKPPPGVVPVELSFTTMGIGGIKIGQAFTIEQGLLPQKYATDFGYIITGVSHNIQDSKWTTDIKTQFYNTKKPTQDEIDAYNKYRSAAQEGFKPPIGSGSSTIAGSNVGPILVVEDDPAPIINPSRVGALPYSSSPVAKSLTSRGITNGNLSTADRTSLVFIGEYLGANSRYINPAGKPEYMLHPSAARAWYRWRDEMKAAGIGYSVSSAYRSVAHQSSLGGGSTVASAGNSPHGWAGALDFRNLFSIVGGSGNPQINLTGRKTENYKKLAEIGAKHGWYNPHRLADNSGTDEIWHFEYWGAV